MQYYIKIQFFATIGHMGLILFDIVMFVTAWPDLRDCNMTLWALF